jgi:hypothetical protein
MKGRSGFGPGHVFPEPRGATKLASRNTVLSGAGLRSGAGVAPWASHGNCSSPSGQVELSPLPWDHPRRARRAVPRRSWPAASNPRPLRARTWKEPSTMGLEGTW